MGRPRVHDEHTRLELLTAAERLLAERGLDALSVRTVADAAGTSTRAVYALFESKEGLVDALAQRTFEVLTETVTAVPLTDDPGRDLVSGGVQGFRRFAVEHPDLFQVFFNSQMLRRRWSPEADATRMAAWRPLIERVERAKAAGILGEHSVQQVVMLWDVLCAGLAAREFCWVFPAEQAERVWTDALQSMLAGLATTQPVAS